MSIADDCMVVNLRIARWEGYRFDPQASRKLVDDNNATDENAARVNKRIVSKESLKDIQSAYSALRGHFYEKTLPWRDNGDRLLPRKLFMVFMQEHSELASLFREAVEHFIDVRYPQERNRAEFRMGDLFKADDYPSASDLRHRFSVHLDIDPVTQANDFRVALDQDQVNEVRDAIERQTAERLKRAMSDVWERLGKLLTNFAERTGDEDSTLRDATFRNLDKLVDTLPALNILNDPDLEDIRNQIKNTLYGIDRKDVKKNPDLRKALSIEAQRIMDEMSGFMTAIQ